MRFIYSSLLQLSWLFIKLAALFNDKLKLFVRGRRHVFDILQNSITAEDHVIWMHVASLGEYEQGLPLLEALRAEHPNHKILLTFFSPSGYEVKKNTPAADVVVYLPMDTISNSRRFLTLAHPSLCIFIKYEIWPNFLYELGKRNIPTFLVSARFSQKQSYFKWYGGFMRRALRTFNHFFVQDVISKELLETRGFKNVTVSGDTRFDRVYEILLRDNKLDFMEAFATDSLCMVAGSTWPEDEAILVDFINTSPLAMKFVIAPHNIKDAHIHKLKGALSKKTICFSEVGNAPLAEADVLIVDTIGLLTKIYAYANLAYVGGGFATGLHNTLEPAVFGVPVLIGPNYEGFKEVADLVTKGGVIPIEDGEEFSAMVERLVAGKSFRERTGALNSAYVQTHKGATHKIIRQLNPFL